LPVLAIWVTAFFPPSGKASPSATTSVIRPQPAICLTMPGSS
jgi:hypothetical protein